MQDHIDTEPDSEAISHIPRSQKIPIPPAALTDDRQHDKDSENESFETDQIMRIKLHKIPYGHRAYIISFH
jgi:hypothetical protein